MTQHLAAQPGHCLQCLRPGHKLVHGRCGTCRARTPADVWNAHYTTLSMQLDAFRDGNSLRPPLVSRLLPWPEAERLLAEAQAVIDAAQVRRVEQIGPRVVLERYQDIQTGEQIQRLTLRIAAEEVA